jgi:ketol-acid reductoisomerase
MPRTFTDADFDPGVIRSARVAVLGYGNQGHAHALNLRDSKVEVRVGAREGGSGWARATGDGFSPLPITEAVRSSDVLVMALPDVQMGEIYRAEVEPHLRRDHTLLFVHGFNIHFGYIQPPAEIDVVMVAPKGPGWGLRAEYVKGAGLPALVAVHKNPSGVALASALSYAWGIGSARSLVLETTFREETECDLFGEQAVLCGGLIELVKAGYETLVDAGYEPEAAYFECVHETKLIVDLLVTRGLQGLREAISDTAEWGGYTAGPQVIGKSSRTAMKKVLKTIQSGEFARDWMEKAPSGELEQRPSPRHGDELSSLLSDEINLWCALGLANLGQSVRKRHTCLPLKTSAPVLPPLASTRSLSPMPSGLSILASEWSSPVPKSSRVTT